MTDERMQQLNDDWNVCDQWDDDEYRDWYDDLTDEERAIIDKWDRQYNAGVLRLISENRQRSTIKGMDTVEQFKVMQFIQDNFVMSAVTVEKVDRAALKVKDGTGESIVFECVGGEVRERASNRWKYNSI